MKTIIPFSKSIPLDGSIAEITSISLEHEINVEGENLTGDFIISGDYKAHAISVNREAFSSRLPFTVELGDNVDRNSINFEILDFNYNLHEGETLDVEIEFSVEAELISENVPEETVEAKEPEAVKENNSEDNRFIEEIEEFIEEEKTEDDEDRLGNDQTEAILSNIGSEESGFVTYHVHIVKENETFESICAIYNVPVDLVKQYNQVEELFTGDKVVIPNEQEE